MKSIPLHCFHPAKLAIASLFVLNAATCLADTPAGEPSPSPVPDVKVKHETIIVLDGASGSAADMNDASRIVGDLATGGVHSVPKVWCGVSLSEIPAEVRAQLPLEEGTGVLVRDAVSDGPAQKAGLHANDVLTKFNDDKITDPMQFKKLVTAKKEGDTVRLSYLRQGHETTTEVTLGRPPETVLKGTPSTISPEINKAIEAAMANKSEGTFLISVDGKSFKTLGSDQAIASGGSSSAISITSAQGAVADTTLAQVDKALRDAGASQEVIDRTRKALEKAASQVKESPDGEAQ